MRDIATKVDTSSTLNAAEFNSFIVELENLVTRAGISLDAAAGPDNDLFMLARSVLIHTQASMSYQDNGAANTFVLAPVQALFEQPTAYVDGMTVRFKAAATNTGACTINVDGLGAITFTKAGGTAYAAGEIVAGNIITANYFNGTNRFEEVSNTTPEASGPAAPDQVAVYADSGSATQITLTIEPGYNQPSAFTDQMVVLFKVNVTNDGVGNHPLNVSGLGVKDLVEKDGTDPIAGRLTADDWVMAVFREVRDEFEIAFVYDNPTTAAAVPATVSTSSGSVFNLDSVPEVRAPTAYTDGMFIFFRAPQDNTATVDINLNGIGARDLRNEFDQNFQSGDIKGNALVIARYNLAQDRFQAIVSRPLVADLRDERSVILDNPSTVNISRGTGLESVNFNAPSSDPLGLYDAGEDTVVIPPGSGIERVDISFTGSLNADGDDFVNAEILIDGSSVAGSGHAKTGGGGVVKWTVTLLDFPVSANDRIDGAISITPVAGGGNESLLNARLTVRVSKVTPP